ncbi:hypothetical protein [Sulfidibacter corallicola]|uniref:Uncharacterized protein n=1 Tax=Sulfidibacter corallicola TaxID=2818388 RepID=A0A8A4TY68_SULCO|nr:hypothetical protein [Sulfidibacter corallicola]QTD54440.1 hypothetical protein J3U87_32980 [Sulfidibacter corallicola]
MHQHQVTIAGFLEADLDDVHTERDGVLDRGNRVLGKGSPMTAMGDRHVPRLARAIEQVFVNLGEGSRRGFGGNTEKRKQTETGRH